MGRWVRALRGMWSAIQGPGRWQRAFRPAIPLEAFQKRNAVTAWAPQGWAWWGTATAAGAALLWAPQTALTGNETLHPSSVRALGMEVLHGAQAEQERAIKLLSGFTMFIEHHDTMVESGLVELLSQAVVKELMDVKVRTAVLNCLADLAKSPSAQRRLVKQEGIARVVSAALQGHGNWGNSPRGGSTARCHAARLLSDLCSFPESRTFVVQAGLLDLLVKHAKEMSRDKAGAGGGRWGRSEEERFLAGALFGIAGSPEGSLALYEDPQLLRQLQSWALCADPILHRCGVGALAKVIQTGGTNGAAAVAASGGIVALVSGLGNADPQAACFASAGVSALARLGGGAAKALAKQGGLVDALLAMASAPQRQAGQQGAAPVEAQRQQQKWSGGVAAGVQRCGLRALSACCQERDYLQPLLKRAGVGAILQDMVAQMQLRGEPFALARQILEALAS